jgi:hypothetical protein
VSLSPRSIVASDGQAAARGQSVSVRWSGQATTTARSTAASAVAISRRGNRVLGSASVPKTGGDGASRAPDQPSAAASTNASGAVDHPVAGSQRRPSGSSTNRSTMTTSAIAQETAR